MASYTGRAWVGTSTYSTSGTAYSCNWTVPSTITNSCTFNIIIRGTLTDSNTTNGGYLRTKQSGTNTSDFYICDSAGNNAIKIQSFSISGAGSKTSNNNAVTINPRALAGKVLYMKEVKTAGDGVHMFGDCAFTITYNTYTDCTAPTSVSVSRSRGTCTITWSGQQSGTNNSITGYNLIRNTSASTSGATTISTSASSGATNAPGAGTFYYGVCSKATYNTSGYKWSSAVTVPSKPSVSAGSTITKAQMDTLKTWINSSSITTVTQYAVATAAHGNTYRSGLTAGSTAFDDAWYNAAANG